MRIVIRIIGALLLLVAVGFLLPGHSHLERSTDVPASADAVFSQINELKMWENWSPWARIDPNTKWIFSEPSSGTGAHYTWESDNRNVGKGKLTILESKPSEEVKCRIEFDGMGESMSNFKLTANDSLSTKLVWSYDADHGLNPISRWFGIFTDKFLGGDYEKGLSNMKQYFEKAKSAQ